MENPRLHAKAVEGMLGEISKNHPEAVRSQREKLGKGSFKCLARELIKTKNQYALSPDMTLALAPYAQADLASPQSTSQNEAVPPTKETPWV